MASPTSAMTEYTILKNENYPILEIWRSPAVTKEAPENQLDLPHLAWRESTTPGHMAKAIKSGEAQVVILTLDDILGSGYESIPAESRAAGAWLLVLVPEPHPYIEMVADRRFLVRSEAVLQVIQGLMRNLIGTD